MFLYYLYKDELDARLDAELAATVLHIAQYYGAPRLAGLCERLLAREIKNGDAEDEGTARASAGSGLQSTCDCSAVVSDARRLYSSFLMPWHHGGCMFMHGWWCSCM